MHWTVTVTSAILEDRHGPFDTRRQKVCEPRVFGVKEAAVGWVVLAGTAAPMLDEVLQRLKE